MQNVERTEQSLFTHVTALSNWQTAASFLQLRFPYKLASVRMIDFCWLTVKYATNEKCSRNVLHSRRYQHCDAQPLFSVLLFADYLLTEKV
jgi:hypothetical protein